MILVGRKFVQFLHEVRDNTIAAEGMVLLIDIPHDLTVRDRIVPVLHVAAIAFIKAIPKQRHHGLPDRLLIVGALTELLYLTIVLPGDYAEHDDAKLLHPVFLNDLPHGIPVHRHFPFLLFRQPGTAVVVIRHDLPPGAVIVVPDRRIRSGFPQYGHFFLVILMPDKIASISSYICFIKTPP